MSHICYKCKKSFGQKSHLDTHLHKKYDCEKCNVNFTTQYAYINGKYIHINSYIKKDKKDKKYKILCARGHELVLVNGNIRKKYFRHKHSKDIGGNPMTKWHCEWQSYFPVTEVHFKKVEKQYMDRRADVLIENHNIILEIQHSNIDSANVICRTHDYQLHNHKLIWIVDGNTEDIALDAISDDNGFLISFHNNWKYKSFCYNYKFILLDIGYKIFKIPVNEICNEMVHVKEYKDIDIVVGKLLNDPENIWDLWDDDNEIKATLTVQQKGAGNGKTYGIWKSISLNIDKETYFIVTKQHTAKDVIKNELEEQAERNEFHIINNMEEIEHGKYGRQYIVEYQHKHSLRKCVVVIGTIDSFMFGLSAFSKDRSNFFEGLVTNIYENGCDKINSQTGSMKYGGRNLKLNKKAQLWIDETQDLNEIYYKAIIKLMLLTKIDVVVVGDKLQSLKFKSNFMRCTNNITNINVIYEKPININRRIKVKHMAGKINKLINFKKYDIPEISMENEVELEDRGENVLEIIDTPKIYGGGKDNKQQVVYYIKKILECVDKEVKEHNYKPNNFLFIFPIMKNNVIAAELETKLNKYWIDLLSENEPDNKYIQYAMLHKHTEGQNIDTTLSKNSSRIMSICASKGDGREVVFVLGCTERSIKKCTNREEKNIVYESYLHVALTRAKHKIYFGLEQNNDNIHKLFSHNIYVEYKPDMKKNLSVSHILENIDTQRIIQLLKNKGIQEYQEPEELNDISNDTEIIDWNYHCIRRSIYYQYAIYSILKKFKNNTNFNSSQIKTILNKLSKLKIKIKSPIDFYSYFRSLKLLENITYIPLCYLSDKNKYKTYCTKISKIINKIQTKYKTDTFSLGDQTPEEAVMQIYIIELFTQKKYHTTTPATIYNIVDYFESIEDNKVVKLLEEANNIKKITNEAIETISMNNTTNWNIEHFIMYGGNNENVTIYCIPPIIGHDKQHVYHLIFKTNYNKLNYWNTLIEILIERFLICNANNNDRDINNKSRYDGKDIKTYMFILKQNKYEMFNWNWDNEINEELKEECKKAIVKYYSKFNKEIFEYYNFIKKDNNKWFGFKSPLEYIANDNDFKKVAYITDFFKYLHQQTQMGNKDSIITLTKNKKTFCDELTKYIEQMCDTFFGLNCSNSNEEW